MPRPTNQQSVLNLLEQLDGLEPLKELFWNELNYERINEAISRRGWNDTAAGSLAEDPVVFAGGGENSDFKIILARLDSDQVRLGLQRPVINRLLRDFPYALFVFSNRDRNAWHFVNVKYNDDPKRRQLFRRISVARDDRLRTASERMAMLDLQLIGEQASPLAIQDRHDEAFDVEKVTKNFFEDFVEVFSVVAKDIQKNNDWEEDTVEKETQTLLNRLLFLYFIQRKGWLNRERNYLYSRFKEQFQKDRDEFTYYSRFLFPLFMRLSTEMEEPASFLGDVPFLNGGLFDDEYGGQQRQDKLLRRTRMKVSNRAFARVFDDVLEKYNFTVREDTPLNQDVSIDPEMLGKIFESLVLQLERSEGKTSRHATGSYYTPRPIVHYMCGETLRLCLESKGQDRHQGVGQLLTIDASDGIDADERAVLDRLLSPEQAKVLRDDLDNLRACDPAVGSGAFPLGLLHELVNLARLCEARSRGRDPVEVDVDWLYNTKSRFIERVIYGVDIQERAVEICKLRLWLSLMVDLDIGVDVDDCSAPAFRTALKRKVTPLPNLDYKIRRADSLVDRIHGQPVHIEAHADSRFRVILSRLNEAKQEFYRAKKLEQKRKWRFKIFDATAELGQHEIGWEKNRLGELIADEKDSARLAELDRAMRELGSMREQIRTANKLKAHQQDDALERFSQRFDSPEKPTFVWQLDFAEVFHRNRVDTGGGGDLLGESGSPDKVTGFDIIVANPPYISFGLRGNKAAAQQWSALVRELYPGSAEYKISVYALFLDLALRLLGRCGVACYITPDSFLLGRYFSKVRHTILSESAVRSILMFQTDFWKSGVVGRPTIITYQKHSSKGAVTAMLTNDENTLSSGHYLKHSYAEEYFQTVPYDRFRLFFSPISKQYVDAIERNCAPLKSLVRITTGVRSKIGQAAVVSSEKLGPTWKRGITSGSQVLPYRVTWSGEYLNIDGKLLFAGGWDAALVEKPKIMIRQTGDSIIAGLDNEFFYHLNNVHTLAPTRSGVSLPYVCALLNSRVINRYYHLISLERGRAMAQTDIETLDLLPYREPSPDQLKQIEILVAGIGSNHAQEKLDAIISDVFGLKGELLAYLNQDELYP